MSAAGQITTRFSVPAIAHWSIVTAIRPLHALVAAPSLLFLATLTVMLFRPPDIPFYWLDRVAFCLLLSVSLLRALVQRRPLRITAPAMWPMAALLLLGLAMVLGEPYDSQNWSVFAAKWAVPFVLYHVASSVFDDAASVRRFEVFALLVLGYLCLIAIFFLFGAKELIFSRYILDESLGIHADRARGPFLQAVANGVTLNLLGLLALNAFRRKRLRGLLALLLLAALPLAILATQTRGVWLSFAGSILVLLMVSASPRVRKACLCMVVTGGLWLLLSLAFDDRKSSFADRLEERSPVEFRLVMYRTGLEMFLLKPLLGWSGNDLQPELAKRINDFHQNAFFFHNTYLEIAVQHGLVGLALYVWVVLDLLWLGSRKRYHFEAPGNTFLDRDFRALWPILVGVYLLNGSFVVMNYQFVNGLLFTMAGMLAGQNRRMNAQLHALPD